MVTSNNSLVDWLVLYVNYGVVCKLRNQKVILH